MTGRHSEEEGPNDTRRDWFGRNQLRRTSLDMTVRDDLESVMCLWVCKDAR